MTASDKQTMRAQLMGKRAALDAVYREQGSAALARHAATLPAPDPGCAISGFLPMGEEIDPWPLLNALAGKDMRIALPAVVRKGQPLQFRLWVKGAPLEEGPMGTRHPSSNAGIADPALLLVPLLGFDSDGYRIGYGGGFYDRTLAALRQRGQVIAAGVAFDEQEVDTLPLESHDERLDWVLTPSRAIKIDP